MPLEQDISDSLNILKEIDFFPDNCCKFAVTHLNNRGYNIKVGYVHLDDYCNLGIEKDILHFWNYDKKTGMNIDITAGQFNNHLSKDKKLQGINLWKDDSQNDIYTEIGWIPDSDNVFLL
jgi:hypothetical protein